MNLAIHPTKKPPQQHVLLVCPGLFDYHASIQRELEAMGYGVTWWDDRARAGTFTKIALRLFPGLGARLLAPRFERSTKLLEAAALSRILVVKGEGLSTRVIDCWRRRWPSALLSLYLWDSVENTPNAERIAPLFDRVATFDPIDARRRGWSYRPLFARDMPSDTDADPAAKTFDWSFIGTLHSDRHRVVERLLRSDPTAPTFVYCYIPGRVMQALRWISDRSLWRAPQGTVSTRPMPSQQVARVRDLSRAVLDIEHPRQRGLTMRTIETLLAGRKLITTNAHIRDSDLFHASRVHLIDRADPRLPSEFLRAPFEPVPGQVRARYTLTQWTQDVIGSPDPCETSPTSSSASLVD